MKMDMSVKSGAMCSMYNCPYCNSENIAFVELKKRWWYD